MADVKRRMYIGTYSEAEARGIHILEFGPHGNLTKIGGISGIRNPSFLDISPSGEWLCAVSESGGKGEISSYRIDPATGALSLLGTSPTGGPGLCHVSIAPDGKIAVAASYSGGSVAVVRLGPGGHPGEQSCFIQHQGSGPNKKRQEKAHAHSVTFSPDGRYVYACDLGMDRIMIYRVDTATGVLEPAEQHFAETTPGAGPRHFAFSPVSPFAYCINELDNTVTAFRHHAADGALEPIRSYPTLPADFSGENTTADIHFHPSGRWLYGSNRGHDSIAIFAADPSSGAIDLQGHVHTGGRTPRNFGIDPSGRYLFAANQDTDNLVVFEIDQHTGRPAPTGKEIGIPKPVCVRFA